MHGRRVDPEAWLPLLDLFQGVGVDRSRGQQGKGEEELGGAVEGLSARDQDS